MDKKSAHIAFGESGESAVHDLIQSRGRDVKSVGGNSHYDLLIAGGTTVEVKTSYPYTRSSRPGRAWQFSLAKNDGRHSKPMTQDLLILRRVYDKEERREPDHFVIPGRLLPRDLQKIMITDGRDERPYDGKYALFLNAWFLLDALVALYGLDPDRASVLEKREEIPF